MPSIIPNLYGISMLKRLENVFLAISWRLTSDLSIRSTQLSVHQGGMRTAEEVVVSVK